MGHACKFRKPKKLNQRFLKYSSLVYGSGHPVEVNFQGELVFKASGAGDGMHDITAYVPGDWEGVIAGDGQFLAEDQ